MVPWFWLLVERPWDAAGARAGTPAAAEQVYHCLGALSRLVGPLTWNVAVRHSGAAGAWRLAAGGDDLLGGGGPPDAARHSPTSTPPPPIPSHISRLIT